MLRSIIDHNIVFIPALNSLAVAAGAIRFTGVADIVVASTDCYLQAPFSASGLVPELRSAPIFAQSLSVHRNNEFLMFGRKLSAHELEAAGLVNRVFPASDFRACVTHYLVTFLHGNDGRSLIEAKH
ncbi:hypothetical protein K3495_g7669 [Podosphaera aphanis]|nr:hypothetical protein K3495_g7669 [Podosphaera aphanis]